MDNKRDKAPIKWVWIHLEFWFNEPDSKHRTSSYFNGKTFVVFKRFMDKLIKSLGPAVRRKFFLFEPSPHCFLAMEVPEELAKMLEKKLNALPKFSFIKKQKVNLKSHDETNGEAFLNFMNGAYDIVMQKDKTFCPPWLKKHPKEKHVLIHAVHCLLNSFTCSRPDEIRFYTMMTETYTVGYKK